MRTDTKAPANPLASTFHQGAAAFESFTPDQLNELTDHVTHLEYASRVAFVDACAKAAGLEVKGDIYDARCTEDIVLRALAAVGPHAFLREVSDLRQKLGEGARSGWERSPQYFNLFGRDFVAMMRTRIGDLRDQIDAGDNKREAAHFLGTDHVRGNAVEIDAAVFRGSDLHIRETQAKKP